MVVEKVLVVIAAAAGGGKKDLAPCTEPQRVFVRFRQLDDVRIPTHCGLPHSPC